MFAHEADSLDMIRSRVVNGATVHADEASSWDGLHARYDVHRVNHSIRFFVDGVCTNWAESYFSRLRRAEIGTHHHIAGPYLGCYAREMAWREDHRRQANGDQFKTVMAASARHGVSRQWSGYWQRNA